MLLFTAVLACLCISGALCLQRVWQYVRCAWMLRGFPGPPPVSLMAGHVALLNSLERQPHRTAEALCRRYGGIFRLRLYWRQVLTRLAPASALATSQERAVNRCSFVSHPETPLDSSRLLEVSTALGMSNTCKTCHGTVHD